MTDELIALERAAALIGIEPKRLLGRLMRNRVGDPIGGETPEGIKVYEWSLKERAADTSTGLTTGQGVAAVKDAVGL